MPKPPDPKPAADIAGQQVIEIDRLRRALEEESAARRRAEEEHTRLRTALDTLTQERVTELAQANRDLRAEVAERRRAEQISRGQTEALSRALTALTQHPDLDTFVGHILRAIAAQLHAEGITFWLHDPGSDTVTLQMAYRDDQIVGRERFGDLGYPLTLPAIEAPSWQTILETRRPFTVDDVATDARVALRGLVMLEGAHSMLAVPLLLEGAPIGWIAILYQFHRRHLAEEVDLAQALAQQATLAVELTRLATQGRESAILQERNRIAREIHDTLAQGFTGVIVQLQAAEMAMAKRPDGALPYIRRAKEVAAQSLAEARRSVWALRPDLLAARTLLGALEEMARSMAAGTSVHVSVVGIGEPTPLPAAIENQLLRIGQEALTNAFKHANAHSVRITVDFEADRTCLRVRDDGRGFLQCAVPDGVGFGLTGMRERVEAVRGVLTIASAPGEGTEIAATVPIALSQQG